MQPSKKIRSSSLLSSPLSKTTKSRIQVLLVFHKPRIDMPHLSDRVPLPRWSNYSYNLPFSIQCRYLIIGSIQPQILTNNSSATSTSYQRKNAPKALIGRHTWQIPRDYEEGRIAPNIMAKPCYALNVMARAPGANKRLPGRFAE
jgi:hypothetical protein